MLRVDDCIIHDYIPFIIGCVNWMCQSDVSVISLNKCLFSFFISAIVFVAVVVGFVPFLACRR